jgi:hypothetical protein
MEKPSPAMLRALRQAHLYGRLIERERKLYSPGGCLNSPVCSKDFCGSNGEARMAPGRHQELPAHPSREGIHSINEAALVMPAAERSTAAGFATKHPGARGLGAGAVAVGAPGLAGAKHRRMRIRGSFKPLQQIPSNARWGYPVRAPL